MAFHTPSPVDAELKMLFLRTYRVILLAILLGTVIPIALLFTEGSALSWILLALVASAALVALGLS
ncbi:MAG TPA: hypothetical protein VL126_06375, partial [Bacteroidota bacterium]|nr:hypothetical protein [Bacteroidota bacterium]